MFKGLLETLLWAFIVIGVIATPVTAYVVWTDAVHDGSIPHGPLWHLLVGPSE